MTTGDVCQQLNLLFQNEIKRQGLVKSGKLLNSVRWTYDNGGFHMVAEDYYEFVDGKHKITENVLAGQAFKQLMEKYYAGVIEDEINTIK